MSEAIGLMPSNATPLMRALDMAIAPELRVSDGIDTLVNVKNRRLPSFLPFLVWEYGLAALEPYVANSYILLDEGRIWQIERDTMAAIHRALGWVDHAGTIAEAPKRRQWWNAFQIYLVDLPAADEPDLEAIERVAELSAPLRSDFRRGVHLYDAGAIETAWSRLDSTKLSSESGVALHDNGPLWSFGRIHEIDHVLSEAEGTALGHWIESDPGGLQWDNAAIAWDEADFTWEAEGVAVRLDVMASWFAGRTVHAALYRGDDTVIGYRRARCVRPAIAEAGGPYTFAGVAYAPSDNPELVIVEIMTDFGDGVSDGLSEDVAAIGLVIDSDTAPGAREGRLWLGPDELMGGTEIARSPAAFTLRKTVREHIKFRLRF